MSRSIPNHVKIFKIAAVALLFLFGAGSVQAATFAMSAPTNGSSITYNATATLTVANVPGGTARIDYYIDGNYTASITSGGTYSFSEVASVPGTYTIYAVAYSNATFPNGTVKGTTATITVNVYPPAPTTTGASGCAGTVMTLTAAGSPSGGTYNWYTAATGGTQVQSGASTTYAPTVSATTTYYVSYTDGGLTSTTRTAVTATVTLGANLTTMPTSGVYFSYPFSGNANDISSSGDNGTLQGAPTLTTDRFGNANSAYSFNGTSQYISTTGAIAAPGPQNFSISVWFKTTSAGGLLVGYSAQQTGVGSQYDRMIYMSSSGNLYFGLYVTSSGAATTINTTSTYADGNWHHAVATCSTSTGSSLYVDGALQAASATMTAPETYTGNGYWRIAYNSLSGWAGVPTDLYFKGSLDDIAVYSTTLSASQVYTDYGAGSSPTCAGSTLSLQANSLSGATYAWSGPLGYSSTSQSPTVSTSATTGMGGTYSCTVTAAGGCSSTIDVTAVVNASPTSAFTATSSVALGANATITYSGTYSATSTYTWSFGSGTIASGSGVGPYTVNWSSPGAQTVTLTVTNSSGCSTSSSQTVTVGTYDNYAFSDPITLNTTTLGISSNLTNFPALLSIQDNNLIISGTCTDKVYNPTGPNYDFAFYDPVSGGECHYQIVSYNQTTGTLLVWVQIPTLTYATNKSLTFYYGSKSPSTTHNNAFFEATWSTDYKGVFHFDETTYTGTTSDATIAGNTGTATGLTSASLVAGKIGNAYQYNGAARLAFSAIATTGSFTASAWIEMTTAGVDQKILTNESPTGVGSDGLKLGVFNNNVPESESGGSTNRGSTPTAPTLATGTWHYLQTVYNGADLYTYVDGVQYQKLALTTNPVGTNPFYVGVGEGGTNYYFNGLIDEVRVSNVAKTSDWLLAEYVNQNNPVTFTTVGSTSVNSTDAATINGALTYTWTGATSTDPTVAGNWNNTTAGTTSQLPAFDGSASLIIPSGLSTYPKLTNSESLYGLTIQSGASLNLNGYTLSVGCNIYNSSTGQILYGTTTSSGLIWNGSAATQTYTGSTTSGTAELGNMTISNSAGGTVTIGGGPVDVYGTITLTKGNLVVGASPAALTLKSTSSQTASVAAIPSGYSISGTVTCERYITGGSGYRTYRLISSPVWAATVSSNNVYSINYLQNSMYLTGSAGGGFDKTGNPTLYLYREDQIPSNVTFTSGNFWGISAINNSTTYNYYVNGGATNYNLPVGNGVMVFFRGNRASATLATETSTTYTTPVTVTTSSSGTLNQGAVTVHSWYTPSSATIGYTGSGTNPTTTNYNSRGFNLVGNPYASSIDWSTFSNTSSAAAIYGPNVGPTIWTFDPSTKNFATYNATTTIATGNGGKIIASGQGFFVQATVASPALTFQEAAKSSAQPATLLMDKRVAAGTVSQNTYGSYLRLKMITDTINYSDMVIGFNPSSSTAFTPTEDSKFVSGMGNLQAIAAISSDSVQTSAKWVPLPKSTAALVIPVSVSFAASGQYTLLRTDLLQVPTLYRLWLMDRYKKDSLDIRANTTYIFDVNLADTGSFGNNRFAVVIREDPALMVHLLNFTALKAIAGSQVNWVTENEANYTHFALQRSTNGGASFTVLDTLVSNAVGNYSYLDKEPAQGANLYRLQITDLNGNITYSSIITIMYGNTTSLVSTGLVVYPNPASSTLNLNIAPGFNSNQYSITSAVSYNIQITNIMGTVIRQATTNEQTWQTDVSSLAPGTYVVKVTANGNNSAVGQQTFIKL